MTETSINISNIVEPFLANKTAFFSDFALKYKKLWRFHARGDLLGQHRKGKNAWTTAEHCLVAGVMGHVLADELHIPQEEKDTIVQALILHDWYKRTEVDAVKKAKNDGLFTYQLLEGIKQQDIQKLRAEGISEPIIALTQANVPETVDGASTLAEQIVWYVDAMMSITTPGSIQQRFDDTERGWTGEAEDPARRAHALAFSNSFQKKYGGTSLFDVQRSIGQKLNKEFSQKTTYHGDPEHFHLFLLAKLVQRVTNYKPGSFQF